MSGTVNRVILIGRLGKDPEVRYTQDGTAVANFSLATDETFTDRAGDKQTRTEWHKIVAWKRLGEIAGEFLTKGARIYIEGALRSHKWQDCKGTERTSLEVVATRMVMLSSKNGSREGNGEPAVNSQSGGQAVAGPAEPPLDDEAPF